MLFGYYKNFAYEDFKQYLIDKNYNELINCCYYSSNQEEILELENGEIVRIIR